MYTAAAVHLCHVSDQRRCVCVRSWFCSISCSCWRPIVLLCHSPLLSASHARDAAVCSSLCRGESEGILARRACFISSALVLLLVPCFSSQQCFSVLGINSTRFLTHHPWSTRFFHQCWSVRLTCPSVVDCPPCPPSCFFVSSTSPPGQSHPAPRFFDFLFAAVVRVGRKVVIFDFRIFN